MPTSLPSIFLDRREERWLNLPGLIDNATVLRSVTVNIEKQTRARSKARRLSPHVKAAGGKVCSKLTVFALLESVPTMKTLVQQRRQAISLYETYFDNGAFTLVGGRARSSSSHCDFMACCAFTKVVRANRMVSPGRSCAARCRSAVITTPILGYPPVV